MCTHSPEALCPLSVPTPIPPPPSSPPQWCCVLCCSDPVQRAGLAGGRAGGEAGPHPWELRGDAVARPGVAACTRNYLQRCTRPDLDVHSEASFMQIPEFSQAIRDNLLPLDCNWYTPLYFLFFCLATWLLQCMCKACFWVLSTWISEASRHDGFALKISCCTQRCCSPPDVPLTSLRASLCPPSYTWYPWAPESKKDPPKPSGSRNVRTPFAVISSFFFTSLLFFVFLIDTKSSSFRPSWQCLFSACGRLETPYQPCLNHQCNCVFWACWTASRCVTALALKMLFFFHDHFNNTGRVRMRHITVVIVLYLIGTLIAWLLSLLSTHSMLVLFLVHSLTETRWNASLLPDGPHVLNTSVRPSQQRYISSDWNQVFFFCQMIRFLFVFKVYF